MGGTSTEISGPISSCCSKYQNTNKLNTGQNKKNMILEHADHSVIFKYAVGDVTRQKNGQLFYTKT